MEVGLCLAPQSTINWPGWSIKQKSSGTGGMSAEAWRVGCWRQWKAKASYEYGLASFPS